MKLNIGKDFSKTPGPRYKHEGKYSGEEFRENHLLGRILHAMRSKETLTIVLDGTSGYGSMFLDEAFGGLIRENHVDSKDILDSIDLISKEEPFLIEEILNSINDASKTARYVYSVVAVAGEYEDVFSYVVATFSKESDAIDRVFKLNKSIDRAFDFIVNNSTEEQYAIKSNLDPNSSDYYGIEDVFYRVDKSPLDQMNKKPLTTVLIRDSCDEDKDLIIKI